MTLQLFCNVNSSGDIIDAYYGENIVATEPYNFFFIVDAEMIENITDYKVALDGFNAQLVKNGTGGNVNE